MTDREKIIKALECRLDINGSKYKYCLTCDYRHDIDHCQWACQTDGILEDALVLLKAQEQEPRDAIVVSNGIGMSGGWWFQCPSCKMEIEPRDRYCKSCGQAVKWE